MSEGAEKKARLISYAVIAALLITMWYMLDLVLLTFLVTFIFYHLTNIVKKRCDKIFPFDMPRALLLGLEYLLFLGLIVVFVSEILPVITSWAKVLARLFRTVDISSFYASLNPRLVEFLDYLDLSSMAQSLGIWISTFITTYSTSAVGFFINLFISLVLAFAMIVEAPKLKTFGERLASSRATYVYGYLLSFGTNFCKTFGTVMRVQVTIAFINSILSMICLKFMGFPGVFVLGLMIFLLGLIPVAGVIISLIPLSIIAISIGGLKKLIEVIIMIAVLHAIEAYLLNPKLMSNKTRMPVCLTFIILLVGQHYMGVWGLLIGVPIFIFLMNMLEVDYAVVENKEERKHRRIFARNPENSEAEQQLRNDANNIIDKVDKSRNIK